MDPALRQLLILRLRGGLRQRLLQLATLRGLLFSLAFGGVIWFLIASNSSSDTIYFGSAALDREAFSEQITTFMPLSMLGLSLLTVFMTTGPTFHFSPNEINFLFTGPFRRKDLIVYKFGAYVAGVTLSSAFITLLVQPLTGSALSVFISSLLTLVFVQLNSAVIGMAGHALDGSRLAGMRRPATALLCAITAATVLYVWAKPDLGIIDLLSEFRHSWIGTLILIPYIVFAQLFVAPSVSHLALWTLAAVVINSALLRTVIVLDARTTERSLVENARLSNRWERIKQGGSFWATQRTEVRSIRRAPIAGGLGPIAWRQALNALRNSFKLIIVFVGLAASIAPISLAFGAPVTQAQTLMIIYVFFAFILPRNLICDFRGDLSRMEIYKTLPITPWRICAGQLVVQVLLAYVIALVIIASALVFEDRVTTQIALVLAAFALPLTLLIHALENTVHLLFPTKLVAMGRADFEFLGRSIVEFIAKTIFVFAAMAVSGAVGLVTFKMMETTLVLPGLASWLTLMLIGLLTLVALQYAFRRFAVAETID
ncbi:putative ABC exporter domain-containing protein [Ovoidimarina sediminis]|uniref:putative ABC exporter domain-containing protein n=1 Tax=Ovoidimarina sediminis TaxID=3079856 RepID=UPI002911A0B6|nr:putative ABC exporter domain-containing protein [Rhodophyticola sp. MJ-SS7]MDU8944691.1 putative ABC exporter domain-containing protein [Rhodophyticola sp. MJ-SS7]